MCEVQFEYKELVCACESGPQYVPKYQLSITFKFSEQSLSFFIFSGVSCTGLFSTKGSAMKLDNPNLSVIVKLKPDGLHSQFYIDIFVT